MISSNFVCVTLSYYHLSIFLYQMQCLSRFATGHVEIRLMRKGYLYPHFQHCTRQNKHTVRSCTTPKTPLPMRSNGHLWHRRKLGTILEPDKEKSLVYAMNSWCITIPETRRLHQMSHLSRFATGHVEIRLIRKGYLYPHFQRCTRQDKLTVRSCTNIKDSITNEK